MCFKSIYTVTSLFVQMVTWDCAITLYCRSFGCKITWDLDITVYCRSFVHKAMRDFAITVDYR